MKVRAQQPGNRTTGYLTLASRAEPPPEWQLEFQILPVAIQSGSARFPPALKVGMRPFGTQRPLMTEDAKLKEMQRNRRLSLQHLRRGAVLFGATGVVLLVVQQLISVGLWIPFIVLGILSLTVIGDAINYIYCGRQIRKRQRDRTL